MKVTMQHPIFTALLFTHIPRAVRLLRIIGFNTERLSAPASLY